MESQKGKANRGDINVSRALGVIIPLCLLGTMLGGLVIYIANDMYAFVKPDMEKFPCLALAYKCGKMGGTACPAMNGANEEAVAMYLRDEIGFYDIYRLVSGAVDRVPFIANPTLEEILVTDRLAREAVRHLANS